MQTASLTLFRFDRPAARLWALAMMGGARLALRRMDGLHFWKLCGSGTGEGFTPVPNTAVYAILAVWRDAETARRQIETSKLWWRYGQRAVESWTLFLRPVSARGTWSARTPFRPYPDDGTGPLAVLTRATVRPSVALRFWGRVPDISQVIGADPSVLFKIGIGEVPMLHQVTFSVWPDSECMSRFARRDGPHARAIRAVREGHWFREELYARFRICGESGSWEGRTPRILEEVHA